MCVNVCVVSVNVCVMCVNMCVVSKYVSVCTCSCVVGVCGGCTLLVHVQQVQRCATVRCSRARSRRSRAVKREVAQVPGSQRCPVKQVALSAGVGVSEKLRGLDLRAHAGFRGEGLLEQISGAVLPSSSPALTAPAAPDPSYMFSSTCPDDRVTGFILIPMSQVRTPRYTEAVK